MELAGGQQAKGSFVFWEFKSSLVWELELFWEFGLFQEFHEICENLMGL